MSSRSTAGRAVSDADRVIRSEVAVEQLSQRVADLLALPGARFADLFATVAADGRGHMLRTVVALDEDNQYLVLESALTGPVFPWVSQVTPAAFVEECELFEQFRLLPPEGHLLNRLAVAPASSAQHPVIEDLGRPSRDTHVPYTVGGHAFEFPVGPVRAVGQESLYYGLVTSGEEVVDLFLQTWHKYRGIERRLQGLEPEHALFLVERGEGLSAASSGSAFCAAVEQAVGLEVDRRVQRDRAICVELERIYNHAQCVAALAQSTGLFVGQAHAEIALEQLLRLNAEAVGHRYLFGASRVGGCVDVDLGVLGRAIDSVVRDLCDVIDAMLETNSCVDRLEATGLVSRDRATALGLVGPIARASGFAVDARCDHSGSGHPLPSFAPALREDGDCLARLLVRREELEQSGRLISGLVAGDLDLAPVGGGAQGWGLGAVESPRGETLVWVEVDNGRLARVRLRTGSARNWRAFDDAVRSQNVFTDVPIIEASFWLTVAGRVL